MDGPRFGIRPDGGVGDCRVRGLLRKRHGRCDILVNNAGVGKIGAPLQEMASEAWDVVMGTNLAGRI